MHILHTEYAGYEHTRAAVRLFHPESATERHRSLPGQDTVRIEKRHSYPVPKF